jgi:betaine-aldehyde dehydrogenase
MGEPVTAAALHEADYHDRHPRAAEGANERRERRHPFHEVERKPQLEADANADADADADATFNYYADLCADVSLFATDTLASHRPTTP